MPGSILNEIFKIDLGEILNRPDLINIKGSTMNLLKKPIHIAMDTETWGKRAGFDARSIGACVIDFETGEVGGHHRMFERGEEPCEDGYEFYIACDNPLMGSYSSDHHTPRDLDKIGGSHRRYHLYRDPDTVDWWYDKTTDKAKAAFANPVDLKVALTKFSDWLKSLGVDPKDEFSCRIWGHGAAFDPPIVEAWFHAVGLPVPWHYRAPRDDRTLFDEHGILDHSAWMKQHQVGTLHHAGDDAKTLGRAVIAARKHGYVTLAQRFLDSTKGV